MNRFGVLNLFVAIGLVASVTAIDCNTKPDFRNAKDCCPHEDFSSNAIVESCKDYLEEGSDGEGPGPGGPHGGHHRGKPHNTCYGECIMNKTELVNFETMEFNEAKAKPFLEANMKTSDFVPVVLDAMKKCAEKGKEMHAMHANDPKPSPPPGGCKPCAAMFLHCVKMEVTINCPSSVWKNDDTCNNVREFMTECKHDKRGPPK